MKAKTTDGTDVTEEFDSHARGADAKGDSASADKGDSASRRSVYLLNEEAKRVIGEDLGDCDLDALTELAEQLDVAATCVRAAIATRRSGDQFCCPITCERMVDPVRSRVSNLKLPADVARLQL